MGSTSRGTVVFVANHLKASINSSNQPVSSCLQLSPICLRMGSSIMWEALHLHRCLFGKLPVIPRVRGTSREGPLHLHKQLFRNPQHLHAEASHDLLCEGQQHVRGNASSQMTALELDASCDLPCEEPVAETASAHSAQMLQPITVTSSASVQADAVVAQDTVHVSPPLLCFLSSSPIWGLRRGDWGYAFFYIRIDLKGSFHTYPPVGGPFQSIEQAYSAIDRYLEEQRHPTMFMDQPGMSQVDKVVLQCLYWPDGTRKKLIDERRDWMRQLVQALLDKYNDYNHLLGDPTYELKDVVCFESVHGPNDHTRLYHHINFTAKTKGTDDDSNCGIEDLFFAELMWKRGERIELVVSCFCVLKPTDNGRCDACDAKHPNDAAYTRQISPLGQYAKLGNIVCVGYDEDLKEEEERVRRYYEGRDDPEGTNRKLTTIQT